MDKIDELLKSVEGGHVLDVAVGKGEFIAYIKKFKRLEKITAVDLSEKCGELLDKNYPETEVNFIIMDAAVLGFPDDTFDTVCFSNSLHHLPNVSSTLLELKRVLKKGGTFIVREMYSDFTSEAQKTHVMLHHWIADVDRRHGRIHNYTFKKRRIRDMLLAMNFSDVEIIEYDSTFDNPKDENMISQLTASCRAVMKNISEQFPVCEELKDQGNRIISRLKAKVSGIDGRSSTRKSEA